jgi:hypothetical protein
VGIEPTTAGLSSGSERSVWACGVELVRNIGGLGPVVSDWSGRVDLVCGMKLGISDRTSTSTPANTGLSVS